MNTTHGVAHGCIYMPRTDVPAKERNKTLNFVLRSASCFEVDRRIKDGLKKTIRANREQRKQHFNILVRACVCACVAECVRARECVRVRACVRACVCVCAYACLCMCVSCMPLFSERSC